MYSESLTGCDANTSFEFKNDGKYALKYFYEQNGQCQFDYEDTGLYNYDQTAQTIVTKIANSPHMDIYKVEKLTTSELVIALMMTTIRIMMELKIKTFIIYFSNSLYRLALRASILLS